MSAVVFDIETVGMDFDDLDDLSKESFLKNAKDKAQEESIKESLGFYPLTAQIVAIGMLECNSEKGEVFFQSPGQKVKNFKEGNIDYIVNTEKEILENFWKKISQYKRFVTFNGRGFDCPFIIVRSGISKVKPTKDLMPYRYDTKTHIDLFDQLSFYGATRRGFSLHMWTKSFGIKSPKVGGVAGAQVKDLFNRDGSLDIARYCMRDVQATKELYLSWEKYIKPPFNPQWK